MSNKKNEQDKSVLWSYRWELGEKPVVVFSNPKSCCTVKYNQTQLAKIIENIEDDGDFVPVPRYVLESALDVLLHSSSKVA